MILLKLQLTFSLDTLAMSLERSYSELYTSILNVIYFHLNYLIFSVLLFCMMSPYKDIYFTKSSNSSFCLLISMNNSHPAIFAVK